MWEMTGRRDTGKAKTSKTRQNLYLFNRFTEEKVCRVITHILSQNFIYCDLIDSLNILVSTSLQWLLFTSFNFG